MSWMANAAYPGQCHEQVNVSRGDGGGLERGIVGEKSRQHSLTLSEGVFRRGRIRQRSTMGHLSLSHFGMNMHAEPAQTTQEILAKVSWNRENIGLPY